jgi:hypothetical protein
MNPFCVLFNSLASTADDQLQPERNDEYLRLSAHAQEAEGRLFAGQRGTDFLEQRRNEDACCEVSDKLSVSWKVNCGKGLKIPFGWAR